MCAGLPIRELDSIPKWEENSSDHFDRPRFASQRIGRASHRSRRIPALRIVIADYAFGMTKLQQRNRDIMRRNITPLMLLTVLLLLGFINVSSAQTGRRPRRSESLTQKGGDWKFPRPNMKVILRRSADGVPIYSIGGGVAAARDAWAGMESAEVIVSKKTLEEWKSEWVVDGTTFDEFAVAFNMAWAVCHLAGRSYVGIRQQQVTGSPDTRTIYQFRTRSGKVAEVLVKNQWDEARVTLIPAAVGNVLREAEENKSSTFETLRLLYVGKTKQEILNSWGRPYGTTDLGGRELWIYRSKAYDPILRVKKDVALFFKYGVVESLMER